MAPMGKVARRLACAVLVLHLCTGCMQGESSTETWTPLAQRYPTWAATLDDPARALEGGDTIRYDFLGEYSTSIEVDGETARAILDALDQVEVGPEATTRWSDFGDRVVVTFSDGTSQSLTFEGHQVVVDPGNPRQAYQIRGADNLFRLLAELSPDY